MNGKWFCAGKNYAINRIMLLSGMQLSGIDCNNNNNNNQKKYSKVFPYRKRKDLKNEVVV